MGTICTKGAVRTPSLAAMRRTTGRLQPHAPDSPQTVLYTTTSAERIGSDFIAVVGPDPRRKGIPKRHFRCAGTRQATARDVPKSPQREAHSEGLTRQGPPQAGLPANYW
jgi:hypothetical protein